MSLLPLQNTKYKLAIFDFDGTIADTSEGILDSHRYTLQYIGKSIPTEEELLALIGGNLFQIYRDVFMLDEAQARKAVDLYRERYAKVGIHKAVLYTGFEDLLKQLKESGYYIGVATLKAAKFAKEMLEEFGISEYFDCVCGMDDKDKTDKPGMIKRCMEICDVSSDKAVMIGDSNNDLSASYMAGTDFIGVTYGFGFKPGEKTEFLTVDDTEELGEILLRVAR